MAGKHDQKMAYNAFARRHLGINPADEKLMLDSISCASIEQLVAETIPAGIRLKRSLNIGEGLTEAAYLREARAKASLNKIYKSYIGLGYYGTLVPGVIARNLFENPGWYTAYTPYQAEIAQGRLEALLNFQTLVSDLTGMEIANASLLDEATAAAEAMAMLHRLRSGERLKSAASTFFVADSCFPQTIDVLKTRAVPLGITLEIAPLSTLKIRDDHFGILVQYPDQYGNVADLSELIAAAHQQEVLVACAADLLSLTLLTPPGEMGADIVVGSTQRFGVPKGFGGPHAAYFAARESYKRHVPGRIIGVSVDRSGAQAYRMALQTREQHIRREKATSNICTAQTLLANMASMYAVYHGPDGLRAIARAVHNRAAALSSALEALGYEQRNRHYFDTLQLRLAEGVSRAGLESVALQEQVNFRYIDDQHIGISLDETTTDADLNKIADIFARAVGKPAPKIASPRQRQEISNWPEPLRRTSAYLGHPVFNQYHTETEMLRYIKRLENKDLSLTMSMIPLGSCTMKLNATAELIPVSWPEFATLHPFVPADQSQGYEQICRELENMLCELTGLDAVSLQPNSGAQGEYTGMLVISAYHAHRGDTARRIALIPSSAHGTNPASAVMAGMEVVIVKCDDKGNIDISDLRAKAEKYHSSLAALMVTYPSTHGVYETSIREVCEIIHQHGGQVYMDGANMNAQVGLTNPGMIGADVCHLNLHKTFSIPHGGGGPGMGPIAVGGHLAPFLPGHVFATESPETAMSAVSAAAFGSASILLISHAYIKMLGSDGLTHATCQALLNANYIKARLEAFFPVLYTGTNGRVAHELIFDCRPFKQSAGVEVEDIAKRLMDYGFHAPTVSFPVIGTIMVEPTESESRAELDRFCEAMIAIYHEIEEIAGGLADREDNVLKNAPHTVAELTADEWTHGYSRQKAAFPLPFVRANKFWPAVARIDNAYGDRNLICSCPPVEAYEPNE